MPHISVTMLPGRTPEQKRSLARKLREVLCRELDVDQMLVSVSVEDLPYEGWCGFLSALAEQNIVIPEEKSDGNQYDSCRCCC